MNKKKPTVDTDTIVVVKWHDAQCDAEWGEIEEPELAICTTVGFLISENKKAICIGSTWAKPHANARMHIPKAWIISKRIVDIKEKVDVKD